jgi:hypothetical protein
MRQLKSEKQQTEYSRHALLAMAVDTFEKSERRSAPIDLGWQKSPTLASERLCEYP